MNLLIHKQIAGLLALALCAASAYAGTYIESTRVSLQNPKTAPQVAKIWADGKRLRTQTDADGHYAIFKDDALYVVDPARSPIWSWTVRHWRSCPSAWRDCARSFSPDSRTCRRISAQIEKLMGPAAGGAAPAVAPSVQQTSRTDSTAGISCTVWDVSEASVKVRELCVAPAAAVPGGADLLAMMKTFVASLKQVIGSFGNSAGNERPPGLVELRRSTIAAHHALVHRSGVATEESKMTSIRTESIPASTFEVPADTPAARCSRCPAELRNQAIGAATGRSAQPAALRSCAQELRLPTRASRSAPSVALNCSDLGARRAGVPAASS